MNKLRYEWWYEKSWKSYCLVWRDDGGNQVGDAQYYATKREIPWAIERDVKEDANKENKAYKRS